QIEEFHYDEEANVTFEPWFARYEDLFAQDASRLDDAAKVRLLGRKLGAGEYARFANYILPRAPRDLSFEEMVKKLILLFGKTESTLRKRYNFLSMTKLRTEDLLTFTGRVKRACAQFEFSSMTEEQFQCLVLVCVSACIRFKLEVISKGTSGTMSVIPNRSEGVLKPSLVPRVGFAEHPIGLVTVPTEPTSVVIVDVRAIERGSATRLADAEDDRGSIVVVQYHPGWCAACNRNGNLWEY
uniref:DUF7083 domain-containing protein n=1 Tax=Anopheles epiroticus TaxID=199890 RepID=A0A182PWN3_9DIPT